MHASRTAHRKATLWLAAIVGVVALSLASPALSQAEESNPNNYNCLGSIAAGTPVAGSEEQQVQYTFYCNGPITGYQVQSQIPVTGVSSPPIVTNLEKGKIVQAISGPYDLGRPKGCRPDYYSHWSRFNPQPLPVKKGATKKGATQKTTSKKKSTKKK